MKLLIEITKADTIGNKFVDCNDCAVARAVKRVVKSNVYVNELLTLMRIGFEGKNNAVWVSHSPFLSQNFNSLRESPDGTVHILEMDIPEQFLKSKYLKPINKVLGIKQCV